MFLKKKIKNKTEYNIYKTLYYKKLLNNLFLKQNFYIIYYNFLSSVQKQNLKLFLKQNHLLITKINKKFSTKILPDFLKNICNTNTYIIYSKNINFNLLNQNIIQNLIDLQSNNNCIIAGFWNKKLYRFSEILKNHSLNLNNLKINFLNLLKKNQNIFIKLLLNYKKILNKI